MPEFVGMLCDKSRGNIETVFKKIISLASGKAMLE
jgi:hypothetical protein